MESMTRLLMSYRSINVIITSRDGESSQKIKGRLNQFDSTAVFASSCNHLWYGGRRLLFVILKRGRNDDGLFCIGAMNRLAVVPQRGLGKAFRHPHHFCPFRPSVAVAM